jgi:hypothetical protein
VYARARENRQICWLSNFDICMYVLIMLIKLDAVAHTHNMFGAEILGSDLWLANLFVNIFVNVNLKLYTNFLGFAYIVDAIISVSAAISCWFLATRIKIDGQCQSLGTLRRRTASSSTQSKAKLHHVGRAQGHRVTSNKNLRIRITLQLHCYKCHFTDKCFIVAVR